jgi:exodeoxyribonuclease VII small subunit
MLARQASECPAGALPTREKLESTVIRADKAPANPENAVSDAPPPPDIAALPFETALAELEGIVTRLERGDVALEESITIYARGEALKTHCEALLRQAEAKVEKITLGADGKPQGTEPLDVERQ